jgi:hypothetical protein
MKQELSGHEVERQSQVVPPIYCPDDLDSAIKRIYEQYGNNLSAFFRDADKEVGFTLQKIVDESVEAY